MDPELIREEQTDESTTEAAVEAEMTDVTDESTEDMVEEVVDESSESEETEEPAEEDAVEEAVDDPSESDESTESEATDTEAEVPIEIEVLDPSLVEVETFDDSVTVTEPGAGVPIEDGTTSVGLDTDLLASAAGLTLGGADNTVDPASEDFAVGFDITEESDFTFSEEDGFTPLGGTIEHTGTVTFESAAGDITVGDFSIGFDESRVSDTTSGFFVANTVEGVLPEGAILFDVGAPESLAADEDSLDIGTADLLVANEFANVLLETELAGEDLTGADVGDAAISGVSEPVVEEAEPEAEEPAVEEAEPEAEAEPVVEVPVVEEPVIEKPVIEEPVVEEPAAEEPVMEEPIVDEHSETSDSGAIKIEVLEDGRLDLSPLADLGPIDGGIKIEVLEDGELDLSPLVDLETPVEAEPEAEVVEGIVIQDGTTSVGLDTELLTEAAGLTLSDSANIVDPASEDFAVGFDIIEESDFAFTDDDGFAPLGGTIEHTGTVTFESAAGDITVGDFSIGFDETRVSDTNSGFFVANTVEGVLPDGAILFDVGMPESVEIVDGGLSLGTADLLVANEFAGILQETELASADLTGADVGDATVDALFG